jgi:hypothetical protein
MWKTPPTTVPPLLLADLLPSDGSGVVACIHGRCLPMPVSLAPLFYLPDLISQYCDMHAAACFQGNKGGYLVTTTGCFLGIRSKKGSSL